MTDYIVTSPYAWPIAILALIVGLRIESKTGALPNNLVLATLVLGILISNIDGQGKLHFAGFVCGIIVSMPIYAVGGAGAGLVKFGTAISLLLGPAVPIAAIPVTIGIMLWKRFSSTEHPEFSDSVALAKQQLIQGSVLLSTATAVVALCWFVAP